MNFKQNDIIIYNGNIGEIWKITQEAAHVKFEDERFDGGFSYQKFFFKPIHHSQSNINELTNKSYLRKGYQFTIDRWKDGDVSEWKVIRLCLKHIVVKSLNDGTSWSMPYERWEDINPVQKRFVHKIYSILTK